MTKYEYACEWIARNDGAGDTPEGMDYSEAMENVQWNVTVALVADTFGKKTEEVAHSVLKFRGFKKPR